VWPALLAEPLAQIAVQMAEQVEVPSDAARIEMHLGALVGRLMPTGGWMTGERGSGAEPIGTGRGRPYDESTLRKHARELAQSGGTDIVARVVEAQVERAVAASGEKAVAYTDIFDQVYWTKKPAHAGPIANRGNRLLAATYFGLSFVKPAHGPLLAYHVSWHKPASPLQDALEALHAEPRRAVWLTATIRHHIWDRGGSGGPTLRWALARRIPYLTVTKGSTRLTRYRRAPRVYTRRRLPVFVRRDAGVLRGMRRRTVAERRVTPEEVIFPAHPDKGRTSTKALRYRTGAPLYNDELRDLDNVYKTRWPCNENPIKALVAVGFDRNLDRGMTLTTSRGTDGRQARLEQREQALCDEVAACRPTTPARITKALARFGRKKHACEQERAAIDALPQDKGARMPTGAEGLTKNLMLLMYNTLAILLMRSPIEQVRAMTAHRVYELLLGRTMLACLEAQRTTLWIDPVPNTAERPLQEELVRLLNDQALTLRGRPLHLRLHDPPGERRLLRVSS
jgi:hypothetical protein